jgi:hypothetical protein
MAVPDTLARDANFEKAFQRETCFVAVGPVKSPV